MSKRIPIVTLDGLGPENCPQCEDEQPLHRISDTEYGCDKCKNIYVMHDGDIEYGEVKKSDKDEFGNPKFPDEVL